MLDCRRPHCLAVGMAIALVAVAAAGLAADDPIFDEDFESGELSPWSSSLGSDCPFFHDEAGVTTEGASGSEGVDRVSYVATTTEREGGVWDELLALEHHAAFTETPTAGSYPIAGETADPDACVLCVFLLEDAEVERDPETQLASFVPDGCRIAVHEHSFDLPIQLEE